MERAHSIITIKAVDEERRVITGIATTPTVDRMGDVVEPMGVKVASDIPLFLYHDSWQTVGRARFGKATKDGIPFEASLPNVKEPGRLKDRVDEAWQMLKYKLITGVSIGFQVLEDAYELMKEGGYRFLKTEVLELSLVPIPAQPEAVITSIKAFDPKACAALIKQIQSIDKQQLAATGRGQLGGDRPLPGDTGATQRLATSHPSQRQKGNVMKTVKELREERQTKAARLEELVTLFEATDHEATEEEKQEFDELSEQVKTLDQDIRIAGFHAIQGGAAKGVDGASQDGATRSRGAMGFVKNQDPDDKFKGQSMTRLAIAKAAAFIAMKEGNFVSAADFAEKRWGKSHPNLVRYIKAAVAGGGTGSGEWGAELAQSDTRYNGDFVEFLYSLTVFDRLPLRSIPARVHIKGQDGAATGYWVGESKAIPVSKPDFSDVELTPLKVGAIAVCSKELISDSDPSAELWIRDSIAQASGQRVDTTFLSAAAASAGVSPAGILNGLSALAPSGADAAAVRADFQALVAPFIAAKNASGLVQIMTPSLAMAISMMVNALGQTEFPDILETGGTLFKRPVFTGDNVTPGDWIVLKPSDIWKIGDSGVQLSMSDSAMVEQNDAPTGATDTPTAASATMVSLWQEESIGFKVVRRINFAKRRTSAVTLLSNAEYGGVVS